MLIVGGEDLKKIKILISLTSINSDEIIQALIGYYCLGVRSKIDRSNWRRAISRIEKANEKFLEIKDYCNE